MDENYMKLAIKLAINGVGKVNPNPLVGAVIVKDEEIIGQGYHECCGKEHAEVNAFKSLAKDAEGATLYVTLEPCSHYGKTPPCVDEIIKNKIVKVVIGMVDINPLVSGRSVNKLRDAGIEVIVGILEEECKKINEVFIKYITKKKPFVVLKSAMSLDGKIATSSGESKWITGEGSRIEVHNLRNKLSSIMVGVNTIIKDNPELTCRVSGGRNPIRIVVDSKLRIPMESKVIVEINKSKTIIATTEVANNNKILELERLGVKVIVIKSKKGKVDLQELMVELGRLNIDGVLLEGGAELNFSALKENIVDKIQVYISPKIIGGERSKTPVGGNGIEVLSNAFKVENMASRFIGEDILIEGYLKGVE